jgi:hypothetical protein
MTIFIIVIFLNDTKLNLIINFFILVHQILIQDLKYMLFFFESFIQDIIVMKISLFIIYYFNVILMSYVGKFVETFIIM